MEKMEETLHNIPGLEAEISQPIQMRNNELLTGIKQDVAIKIFGDDLSTLTDEAGKVEKLISGVRGVSGVSVEQVSGLPQIQVTYDHERLAEFGISVDDVNQILETTFAGSVAGAIFEGEKKFDLVLRMDKDMRDVESLRNLAIPVTTSTDTGSDDSVEGGSLSTIPLSQVADITYAPAPAQI